MTTPELDTVAELFRMLAEIDFRGASPLYDRLACDAADDPEVLSLLLPAAPNDRLPHLLFAAIHDLLLAEGSSPVEAFASEPFDVFRSWCLDRRGEIEALTATHVTQTNEVGRCAAILPCLATVAESARSPLAIIEVGTSAGLNLLFDRYRYVYGPGAETGPVESGVVLRPRMDGDRIPPLSMPAVTWRRGLDRLPVDVTDDAVRWLRACIWPEQRWRRDLLDAAVAVARVDPPTLVAGDAIEALPALVDSAPPDAAICIVHTAVLPYLPDRHRFANLLVDVARERPLWWVSGEPQGLISELVPPTTPTDRVAFLYGCVPLGMPGRAPRPLARAGSHGAWLEWLEPST